MIKYIIQAAVILLSSYSSISQPFSFSIQGPDAPAIEGFTVDYRVTYFNLPQNYNFTVTAVNGTIIPGSQLPPFQYIRVKWNCLVPNGSITLTETISGQSYTYNTTVTSYLSSSTYCNIAIPLKQNNNYGQWPDILDITFCSPYCISSYSYQWQVGDVPIGVFPQIPDRWSDIPFATGITYQPPIYNTDCIKAYRRKTTYSDALGLPVTKISGTAVISTFDFLNAGTISGGSIFNNGVPLITQTPATGGLCDGVNFLYSWEISTNGLNFSGIGTGVNYPAGIQIPGNCFIRRKVECGIQTLYSNILNIIVQPLNPGTITGGGSYSLNTIPAVNQTPASGGACSLPDYIYTWERLINNGTWVTFGSGINYPSNAGIIASCLVRRKVHCVYEDAYTAAIAFTMLPYTSPNTENQNYVRINEIVIPTVHSWEQADALVTGEKLQTTNYIDGFGRTVQKVIKQGSLKQSSINLDPDNLNNYQDLVSHIQYDGLGRIAKEFLPYATPSNLGFYKPNAAAEQQSYINIKYGEPTGSIYTFAQTTYDGSPLNRVINKKLPGFAWNNNPDYKGISAEYNFNKQIENIRIWDISCLPGAVPTTSGIYGDNQLTKYITKDETAKITITYTDLSGNIILKRVQEANTINDSSYSGWLNSYYVYDDFDRLRYIITPKAVSGMVTANNWTIDPEIKKGLCFYLEFDKRGRVTIKHLPDAGEIWMVYDKRDRLVFSQDENQRNRLNSLPAKPNQWSYVLYDDNDRTLGTGLIDDSRNRINMQAYVDGLTMQNEQVNIFTGNNEIITCFNPVVGNFPGSAFPDFFTNSLSYYDEYNASSKSFIPLTNNNFAPVNSLYAEPYAKSLRTKGLVTTSKIRVLDENYDDGQVSNDRYIITTSYIDERGRVIQIHTENILGGTDIASVQYDFAGKVLCTKEKHNAPGNVFNDLLILTKNDHDLLGRIKKLRKLYSKNASDISNLNKYKSLSELAVDDFGRAKIKKIGVDPNNPAMPLEVQDYTYNIQGSLTGINKDYALGSGPSASQWYKHFGMYLGYENSDRNFVASQWNKNITGVIWRSQGDNIPRKYNYEYDNVNRFKAANFAQKNKIANSVWETDLVNLSAAVTYQDDNGNINTMQQMGIIPGTNGGVLIDILSCGYFDKSNKLKSVTDQAFGGNNVQNGKQGDFKNYQPSNGLDYDYDKNGNLKNDKNKNILNNTGDGIVSNFLDLPHQIIIKDKSKTEFTYDASGNKLVKKVILLTPNPPPPKTTYYVGGFVYESSTSTGQPAELQYIINEEGKLRLIEPVAAWSGPSGMVNYLETRGNIEITNTGTPGKWGVWDYYLKDNLSNIRMLLTEEYHQQQMFCSMEDANADIKSEEEATFSNAPVNNELVNTRRDKPSPWNSNLTFKVSKLLNTGNTAIGPNAILKIMAGDKISGNAKYFYQLGSASNNNSILNNIVNSLLLALGGSPNTASAIKDNVSQTYLSSINGPINNYLNNQQLPPNSNTPKAYINYIFFDEQFRYVGDNSSGAQMVLPVTSGNYREGVLPFTTQAQKNGYVYIYLSNESQNIPVYFDDLQIIHDRAPIVEDNAYYPHGLKIQGISAKAAIKPKTRNGYQGAYNELDEETGYNEFNLRDYDPQIGRWIQADPNIVEPGMYNGMGNNPVNLIDPSGGDPDWYDDGHGGVLWLDRTDETFTENGITYTRIGSNEWMDPRETVGGYNTFFEAGQKGHVIWKPGGKESFFRSNQEIAIFGTGDAPLQGTLKEIPQSNLSFWQQVRLGNSVAPVQVQAAVKIASDITNDAYIAIKNHHHEGYLEDIYGDLVGADERVASGVRTFQLAMAPTNIAISRMTFELSSLNPKDINFMQKTISNKTGDFTVLENAINLKSGILNPETLKMNVWRDGAGKIWTLDHRRLAAFRLSGLQEAPVQWADPSKHLWKMGTTNGGTSIWLNFGKGNGFNVK